MKNSKNGFTLVEMLVCIAIIAALSITIGLNATKVLDSSQKNDYEELFDDIFDAAKIYVELSSVKNNEDITRRCNINTDTVCTIDISFLIEYGLLDENILTKKNPVKSDAKFLPNDEIQVERVGSAKKKVASYNCGKVINSENLESFDDWGKGTC